MIFRLGKQKVGIEVVPKPVDAQVVPAGEGLVGRVFTMGPGKERGQVLCLLAGGWYLCELFSDGDPGVRLSRLYQFNDMLEWTFGGRVKL